MTLGDPHDSLPVACTLGAVDGVARLQQWRELYESHGAGRLTAPGELALRFRDADGVGVTLRDLVEAERECCGFVQWQLSRDNDEWCVEINGDDDQLLALPLAR